MSSCFDLHSVQLLKKIKLKRFKIPSGEINNVPLLELISKLRKKVILSTGMSSFEEISFAYKILKKTLKIKILQLCIAIQHTRHLLGMRIY